ncbi:DUF3089 domain-containing protein [Neobacillus sp. SM06]|uniref:DUF3089 domain-containing protein n=1 Tax=Neobacillus sp. SM06 TaxID=3422492 RepID=UPI003D270CC1
MELKFVELQKALFRLVENENLAAAYSLLEKAQQEFPEKLAQTTFWKACFFASQDQAETAIKVLNEGIQQGVWWHPTTFIQDPDLKGLQNRKEFQMIVKKCEALFEREKKSSKSHLFIFGNNHSETAIFSLHWKASNVKDFAPYWLNDHMVKNYFFGFPQSSQVYGYHSYCWDNQVIAYKEIALAFKEFQKKNNAKHTILAGASQGGKLSIELSLSNTLSNIKGFIAVIPAIKDVSSIESLLKEKRFENVKGCIITGDQDPFYQKTLELRPIFKVHNIPCKFIVLEGLGHFFPSNFPELMKEAVEDILYENELLL